eukprot:g6942.t1
MAFELLRPHVDRNERQLYRTAEVASPTSSGSTVYSIVLVVCNLMFFSAVFMNAWAATKEAVANNDVTDVLFGVSVRDVSRSKDNGRKEGRHDERYSKETEAEGGFAEAYPGSLYNMHTQSPLDISFLSAVARAKNDDGGDDDDDDDEW